MANGKQTTAAASGGATLGFEKKLWDMADALRNNMDAAEYKHVVLGLIFLKYISDAFEAQHARLEAEREEGADPRGPRRVPRRPHLLGAAERALGARQGAGSAADDRRDGGRGDGRDRAGEPVPPRRAPEGIRPPPASTRRRWAR